MLRSLKELYGDKLGASDGEIGRIKDFYFDDRNWSIRYIVADTGTWLPGRQVLISPHSIASPAALGKIVDVGLTRKQIENSPSIESQKPVSRQHEEEYHKYFGLPPYWEANTGDTQPAPEGHLRSAQAVNGYLVRMGEETIGHICDFMIDAESWMIGQLVVKTGHRLSGKEMIIETKQVERIGYDESTIFAHLIPEISEPGAANRLGPVVTPN